MEKNTEIFIEQFNVLEATLKKKLHKKYYTPFMQMIQEASLVDPLIRKHLDILDSFGDLRNVLVHKEGNEIIAVPSDVAVEKLNLIVAKYLEPKLLYNIIKHEVIMMAETRGFKEALQVMKAHNYTKIPVYVREENPRFVGLLSGNVVTRWLALNCDDKGNISVGKIDDTTVGDLLLETKKKHQVTFIPRSMNVYEWLAMNMEAPPVSGVYIMTQNGKATEKPIGIITAYDYQMIAKELEL